jgi:hypothetical protein
MPADGLRSRENCGRKPIPPGLLRDRVRGFSPAGLPTGLADLADSRSTRQRRSPRIYTIVSCRGQSTAASRESARSPVPLRSRDERFAETLLY